MKELIAKLLTYDAFTIQKVSAGWWKAVASNSINLKYIKQEDQERIKAMIRMGKGYRCRIGSGPWFYADNTADATNSAILNEEA